MQDVDISSRIRACNDDAVRAGGEYVVYWMIAARRTSWNFSLERAIWWARRLSCPLIIFEPLRVDYAWASERLHRFVIDGMRDNDRTLRRSRAFYFPYVEPRKGAGSGLLEALSARAAVIVTDEFPGFFLPRCVPPQDGWASGSRPSTATACCRWPLPRAPSQRPRTSDASSRRTCEMRC